MRTTITSLFTLSLLAGCFGGGGGIFGDDTHLQDNYGSSGTPVRGAYALGAEVTFSPDFSDDDVGAATDIQLTGTALVETSRSGASVTAEAREEGTGVIAFSLRGVVEETIEYQVRAADTLEFRRVFDVFGREDLDGSDVVFAQGDGDAELVIDYYAGDLRLFGHAIATAGDGGTVRPTNNNDRLDLDTSVAGARTVDLTLVGGGVGAFSYDVVDSVAAIVINMDEEGDSVRFEATATDAMGREIRSPFEWLVDGEARSGRTAGISIATGSNVRTVTARLLDQEDSVQAMLE